MNQLTSILLRIVSVGECETNTTNLVKLRNGFLRIKPKYNLEWHPEFTTTMVPASAQIHPLKSLEFFIIYHFIWWWMSLSGSLNQKSTTVYKVTLLCQLWERNLCHRKSIYFYALIQSSFAKKSPKITKQNPRGILPCTAFREHSFNLQGIQFHPCRTVTPFLPSTVKPPRTFWIATWWGTLQPLLWYIKWFCLWLSPLQLQPVHLLGQQNNGNCSRK